MDARVKKFVNDQKVVAEKIRKNIGANEVEVKFYEIFPAARLGHCMIADNVQKLIPFSKLILDQDIMKKKLTVEMSFVFPIDKKINEKKAKDVFCNIAGTNVSVTAMQNRLTLSYNKDPHKIMS